MNASLERLRTRRERLEGEEGGFTLIELLIVIVILAILAAIVVFAVQNLTGSSAKSSCRADYKTVETGVEAYKAQMGNWPRGGAGAVTLVSSTAQTDVQDTGTTPTLAVSTAPAGGVNAAAASGALLTASDSAVNLVSPSGSVVGPWLKDAPVNTGHYAIFVSNDGKGTIQVLDGNGKVTSTATGSPTDCNLIN